MSSVDFRSLVASILNELLARQRTLATYGLAMLLLSLVTIALQFIDLRSLESGVNVWVKPAKFFSSVAIFSVTAAWFFGYVRPERRRSRLMRSTIAIVLVSSAFELLWISWQGGHGLESHFNRDTPFFELMYRLMGLSVAVLVATTLPLAWEIGRRPAVGLSATFVASVVLGLVLTFLLGGLLGGYMSVQAGHAVGPEHGRTLMFGWNRSGGDLRVAHFLGIHAQQAIPILGAVIVMSNFKPQLRWPVLIGGTIVYAALTLALFAQAVAGQPLFPSQ